MKTNNRYELAARIGRQSLALAAFFAVALLTTGIGRAQSSATPAPAAKTATLPAKAPLSPDLKKPPKGSREGIVVHGHWTLEVKNPDGTLVERREFENALDSSEGADLLTGTLSGEYSPQGFYVQLFGICGGACVSFDTRSFTSSTCSNALAGSGAVHGLFCTITYTPNSGASVVGYTLSGSVTSIFSGAINAVSSGILSCLAPSSPAAGVNSPPMGNTTGNAAGSTAFASVPPGNVANVTPGQAYCGANNFGQMFNLTSASIAPVTVVAGQSVSATVAISFSSGGGGS